MNELQQGAGQHAKALLFGSAATGLKTKRLIDCDELAEILNVPVSWVRDLPPATTGP
jgi:tRNA C32,U32 (ribose-2'-O)-methylase TrmJ